VANVPYSPPANSRSSPLPTRCAGPICTAHRRAWRQYPPAACAQRRGDIKQSHYGVGPNSVHAHCCRCAGLKVEHLVRPGRMHAGTSATEGTTALALSAIRKSRQLFLDQSREKTCSNRQSLVVEIVMRVVHRAAAADAGNADID